MHLFRYAFLSMNRIASASAYSTAPMRQTILHQVQEKDQGHLTNQEQAETAIDRLQGHAKAGKVAHVEARHGSPEQNHAEAFPLALQNGLHQQAMSTLAAHVERDPSETHQRVVRNAGDP